MSVDTTTLAQLAPGFTGRLLQPADAEYDDARRVHNGLVDKHPAIIARCRGVADVCDAVKLARALELEVAVRGGGHNVAGHAVIDGGLMIDLAPMKGIHVDPCARVARAQGGVLWSEFDALINPAVGVVLLAIGFAVGGIVRYDRQAMIDIDKQVIFEDTAVPQFDFLHLTDGG